jgi:hypothetical protein
MKDFKVQSELKSSAKEKSNAKTFRIPISNGIFEHYGRLRDARWLLDLFVDWTTKEVPTPDGRRDGIVLGGKPIRDEDTASAFHGQCTERTTRRWRQRLARFGYISQKRTPVGYVIRVKKSKKWAHLQASEGKSERPKMADHSESELPNVADQTARNARSELPNVADPIKTLQLQDRDRAVEDATAAVSEKAKTERNPEAWEAVGIDPCGSLKFVLAWESIYRDRLDDESLSVTMECAIQYCQENSIRVPPPFFNAKRLVERNESETGSDEVARFAGPTDYKAKARAWEADRFPSHPIPE